MLIKTERGLEKYQQSVDALNNLTLSSTSPSGVRYTVEMMPGRRVPSVVAGTPVYTGWPPDKAAPQQGQYLYPMDYEIAVQVGWLIEEIAIGMWIVEPDLVSAPAAIVRELLDLRREIKLLTAIVQADTVPTVH